MTTSHQYLSLGRPNTLARQEFFLCEEIHPFGAFSMADINSQEPIFQRMFLTLPVGFWPRLGWADLLPAKQLLTHPDPVAAVYRAGLKPSPTVTLKSVCVTFRHDHVPIPPDQAARPPAGGCRWTLQGGFPSAPTARRGVRAGS